MSNDRNAGQQGDAVPKLQNYPIYIPFKAGSEDAAFLEETAQAQQITRSAVLRDLIQSQRASAALSKTETPAS